MRVVRDHQDAHTQPSELPKINEKDMVKAFDSIDAYPRTYFGETNIPLQYITRENPKVVPSVDDPSTNYATIDMEMIARAPHEGAPGVTHPIYAADNHKVLEIMEEIVRDSNGWTWIKSHSRRHDGCGACWSLHNHYLVASKTDNVQASAEGKLNNTIYQGEKRRFNFERCVQIHKEQHTALDGLEQHGYAPMDERTKVRLLLAGIRTSELDSVKSTIWTNAHMRSSFDECVELFKTFIHQSSLNATKSVNISWTNTFGGGRGRGGRGGGGRYDSPYGRGRARGQGGDTRSEVGANGIDISARYYNDKQFDEIGPESHDRVLQLRADRDAKRNGGRDPDAGMTAAQVQTTIVAAVNGRPEADSEPIAPAPAAIGPPNANHNNPALQRVPRTG
jgi:hypothetical protein